MKLFKVIVLAIFAILLPVQSVFACDTYTNFSTDEIKELRGLLGAPDIDPLDRRDAFLAMVCAGNPNLRHYAIKESMKVAKDSLLRNEIMMKSMMLKTRIDIELNDNRSLTKQDKAFVATHGGRYSHPVMFRSEEQGCIGLYRPDCRQRNSLFIVGDRVEYNYDSVKGEFWLSETGELVGTLRAGNYDYYTHIPAVIKLF